MALRPVERGVGVVDEPHAVEARGGSGGDAGREREPARVVEDRVPARGARQQPPDDAERGFGGRVGQEERELVPADAEGPVGRPQRGPDEPPHRRQELVAGRVPIGVVHPLQVVEVEDHERERPATAGRVGDLAAELLLEGAVVGETGERVHAGVEPSPIVGLARLPQLALEAVADLVDRPVDPAERRRRRGGRGRRDRGHGEGEPGGTRRRRRAGRRARRCSPSTANASTSRRRTPGASLVRRRLDRRRRRAWRRVRAGSMAPPIERLMVRRAPYPEVPAGRRAPVARLGRARGRATRRACPRARPGPSAARSPA